MFKDNDIVYYIDNLKVNSRVYFRHSNVSKELIKNKNLFTNKLDAEKYLKEILKKC